MRLDEIGIKQGTDKSSLSHCYLPFYEWLFPRFSYLTRLRILEIGVQFGNSIRAWREYFGEASTIIGIDSVDNGVESKEGLSSFLQGDAYQPEMVDRAKRFGPYQIMIDDAYHALHHQQYFLINYAPLLADDGIMIVEDVHGLDWIPQLASVVGSEFYFCSVDLTFMQKNTNDSILFLAWRK